MAVGDALVQCDGQLGPDDWRTTVIDVEGESLALRQRSLELVGLLDAGHPVVKGSPAVLAESKRLGAAAHAARKAAAVRVAAGLDADVPVGRAPAVRRVRTDWKGRDLDPLHGRPVVSPQLVAYWEHRRDVVAPAVEASYRQAAEACPYREPLAACARGHLGLLRDRRSMLSEGGVDLEAALARYDGAFEAVRMAAIDAQHIATQAIDRLASLRRIEASLVVGGDDEKGFISATLATVADTPVSPDTLLPVGAGPGRRR
jgi:hypothetical protein